MKEYPLPRQIKTIVKVSIAVARDRYTKRSTMGAQMCTKDLGSF